ncbi:tetratricopeptide repeat-containing sensor histidine kinase [Daejeonella lutea]|nr:histidine kinase [Daejeonella lutea]
MAFKIRLADPKKTILIATKALKLAKKINYIPGVAEANRVAGVGFSYLENTPMATKHYIEALRFYKQLGDKRNVARIYNNVGNLYKYSNYDKALKHYNNGLKIAKNINDEELTAGMYFNTALIYSKRFQYEKSMDNFDRSYGIFKKLKDTTSIAIYFQNTGHVFHRMGEIDSAKTRLFKGISTAKDLGLYSTLGGCYLSLGYIYLQQDQFTLCEQTIGEGMKYASKVNSLTLDNDFTRLFYELELKRKNYRKALKYLALVYHNDSLLLNENQSSNIDFNSQHFLQQQKIQEKELIIAEQKYREARTGWIITLGILILLLTVGVVLAWYFIREKKRRREEVLIQNKITTLEQKALHAMMNPHFVFNVMNSIQHFVNQSDLKQANQVLSGFARLARKHLEICINSTISVQEELVYLELYLSMEKTRFPDKMNYIISFDKDIDTDEITIPSMLIQPFLENAIWHGIMPKEVGGNVSVHFDMIDTNLLVKIIDDGIGILNSEKLKKTRHVSRGMTLIRERISLLNRLNKHEISIDQRQTGESGTEILIKIPI